MDNNPTLKRIVIDDEYYETVSDIHTHTLLLPDDVDVIKAIVDLTNKVLKGELIFQLIVDTKMRTIAFVIRYRHLVVRRLFSFNEFSLMYIGLDHVKYELRYMVYQLSEGLFIKDGAYTSEI